MEAGCNNLSGLAYCIVRDTSLYAELGHTIERRKGRHQEDALLGHLLCSLSVEKIAMLNRIYSNRNSIEDALQALSMCGHLALRLVSLFNNGLQLLNSQLGRTWLFALCIDAASCHNFDEINPGAHHRTYPFAGLVGAIDLQPQIARRPPVIWRARPAARIRGPGKSPSRTA